MNQNAMKWIVGGDTGISSKTIWSVMQGVATGPQRSGGMQYDVPYDSGDFGRCFRLLELVPEWREQMAKVAEVFPAWKPFVDVWPELEALYREERPTGRCPKLYARMQELVEESRILDGWKKTGPGSWSRAPI